MKMTKDEAEKIAKKSLDIANKYGLPSGQKKKKKKA